VLDKTCRQKQLTPNGDNGQCLKTIKKKSIKHILPSSRLLIWLLERNNIKLHVQVFLRMKTWVFETCRRHYNYHVRLVSTNSAPRAALGLLFIIRQIFSDHLICIHVPLRCSRSRHQSYESLHIVLSYSYSTMYNLMMATTRAETCIC